MSKYNSPEAFKSALKVRLDRIAQAQGEDVQRTRLRMVFERFLIRLGAEFGESLTVKGGLALLLRTPDARATKDLDLHLFGNPDEVLTRFQRAGLADSGDFMIFAVQRHKHPDIVADALPYGGQRFRVECRIGGKQYAVFSVDLAFAESLLDEPEHTVGADVWGEMGLEPGRFRLYPRTTHVAEKLHAYTLPREHANNTRVKDLPDLGILASMGGFDAARLLGVIQGRFRERSTHEVPLALPVPDPSWEEPYAAMARSNDLRWHTLSEVHGAVSGFLNPVLAGLAGSWDPAEWDWR